VSPIQRNKSLENMAGTTRLELATSAVTATTCKTAGTAKGRLSC
jgi:hypothetical protein